VATCFVMKWVSVLLDIFKTTVYSVNSKNACETRPSANASSTSDFKPYTTLYVYLVRSSHPSRHISTVNLEPLDPMVSVHIGRVTNMIFTHLMWVVLSLFCRTSGTRCVASGGTRLKSLTTRNPFDILPIFFGPASDRISEISIAFHDFSSPSARGFSHIETAPISWNDLSFC